LKTAEPYFAGDHELDDGTPNQRLMVCVYEGNLGLVWSRGKTSDDDRSSAGVGPDPLRTINRDMEMPDARRQTGGLGAEHGDDLEIFGAVVDERNSAAQRFGQWRMDHEFRRRLSSLSVGVGRPQNGYRYDNCDKRPDHVFSPD
jgi:hypothetical protein